MQHDKDTITSLRKLVHNLILFTDRLFFFLMLILFFSFLNIIWLHVDYIALLLIEQTFFTMGLSVNIICVAYIYTFPQLMICQIVQSQALISQCISWSQFSAPTWSSLTFGCLAQQASFFVSSLTGSLLQNFFIKTNLAIWLCSFWGLVWFCFILFFSIVPLR